MNRSLRFAFLAITLLVSTAFYGFSAEAMTVHRKDSIISASANPMQDSRAAIQKLIDSTPVNGKLTIPAGIYYIGDSAKSYAKYVGVGTVNANCDYGLIVNKPINIEATDVTFQYNCEATPYTAVLVYKTQNVTINGLSIVGSSKPTTYLAFRSGLEVFFSKSVTASSLSVSQTGQGILVNRSNNCVVNACSTSETSASGIEIFASSYDVVQNCSVTNANDGDISLYGWIGGSNNQVLNNTVAETGGNDGMQGITSEVEVGDTISGNKVTGMYYGIDIKNGTKNATISKNTATGNVVNIAVRGGDLNNNQAASSGIAITGNNASFPAMRSGASCIMIEKALKFNGMRVSNNLVGYTSATLAYVTGTF